MSEEHLQFPDHLKRMDPRFITLDRERYMRIYEAIRHGQRPDLQITTTEVAQVVRGDLDTALPRWATNSSSLAQLSAMITQHQYVWACPECDSIVSFYNNADDAFVMAACKVYSDHPVPCPYCRGQTIALWDAKALLKGKPLAVARVANRASPAPDPPAETNATPYEGLRGPSTANKAHLARILEQVGHTTGKEGADKLNFLGNRVDLTPQFGSGGMTTSALHGMESNGR